MQPNADKSGVAFGIQKDVPVHGGNAAQKREHDKRLGEGTMSRAGAKCPCCGTIMTMRDIKIEGRSGNLGNIYTAVITEAQEAKSYRLPTLHEIKCIESAESMLVEIFDKIPFGLPTEPTPAGGGRGAARAFSLQNYGLIRWGDLFSIRQKCCLGIILRETRNAGNAIVQYGYSDEWKESIYAGLAIGMDRIVDRQSLICRWDNGYTKLQGTFTRFALPITWDYCEGNPLSETTGNYLSNLLWVCEFWEHATAGLKVADAPDVLQRSAMTINGKKYDCIITDPPYYDAIPYSDLMDFFYVWLKRTLYKMGAKFDESFSSDLSPKWNADAEDGELIDDDSRHNRDPMKSKAVYEKGMERVFEACFKVLTDDGRLVIVFAHKHPDAWETLVSAIIRSGFVTDGSWPIRTEMGNRTRALSGASLASSVWLVCKKRPVTARIGWDNKVLEEMRANITERLRDYWDAGIRGPDFVWAATGPALEAYSKHPIVKKANAPGQVMPVGEFLSHVRRMVVDFVVGQVLTGEQEESDMAAADRMDAPTAYYLLHRHDFGLDEAPAGACILYATACGLSDRDLESSWDLVAHKGSTPVNGELDPDEDADPDENGDTGSTIKLKTWAQRVRRTMGYEAPSGRPIPLIDRVHRLMHLWRGGDVHLVDEYLDDHGLRRQELFKRLVQSLIELSNAGSEERSLLESLSNHIQAKGVRVADPQKDWLQNDVEP